MTRPVDVHGILERAGADADAPEGSQAWALAQVDAAVAELIERERAMRTALQTILLNVSDTNITIYTARAALANVGATK